MPEENDPKPAEESTDSKPDDGTAAAKEMAKEIADNAGAAFKGLEQKLQIYLIALAVTLLCSMIFGAFKMSVNMSKEVPEIAKAFVPTVFKDETWPSLLGLNNYKGSFGGKFAFLGSAVGIGILIWSTASRRKDPWIPLSLAGAAGIATLGILATRLGTKAFSSSSEYGSVSHDGTILGWWLPLAAAVAATVVSVQRIVKA